MFADHTISQQYDILTSNGKYIGKKHFYNFTITLYLLDDEFYELWYFPETNEIEKIEKLNHDDNRLNLYIQQMN